MLHVYVLKYIHIEHISCGWKLGHDWWSRWTWIHRFTGLPHMNILREERDGEEHRLPPQGIPQSRLHLQPSEASGIRKVWSHLFSTEQNTGALTPVTLCVWKQMAKTFSFEHTCLVFLSQFKLYLSSKISMLLFFFIFSLCDRILPAFQHFELFQNEYFFIIVISVLYVCCCYFFLFATSSLENSRRSWQWIKVFTPAFVRRSPLRKRI